MELKQFKQISIYNHDHTLKENLSIDQILQTMCDENELIIRFWVSKGIIFGKLDTTCASFEEGVQYLDGIGMPHEVRKAGGLAVVLDEGTLNISLVFSTDKAKKDLHESYRMVVSFLQDFFAGYHFQFTAKIVPDSYCPGDYDLVADGKKFCGIAQFRNQHFVVVALNLVVSGDQNERLRIVKKFYELANTSNKSFFPKINEHSMETLEKLMKITMKPEELVKDFEHYLSNNHTNVKKIPRIG